MTYRNYEDAAKTRLIAATMSLVPDADTLDDLVAFVARVSNPSNQSNKATAKMLIKYLIKHKHWSPLDMVNMVVEVDTTRDIGRQMLRHSSMKFQEYSQRYAEAFEFVLCEPRMQDAKNRQSSLPCEDPELAAWWVKQQVDLLGRVSKMYDKALKKGIAKECARKVLPEGLTMSRLYINGSVRSWIHYLELRLEEGTQKEHRLIANLILTALRQATDMVG